jgi:hypothetical protein
MSNKHASIIPTEILEQKIYLIRGQKVMRDADLAALYGVQTKALVQAVKRNPDRFPKDFMFQLSQAELKDWRSQFVTSNSADKMGLRRAPYVFTEQGVAMLSSVLKSRRAIQVNVAIMRVFVKIRTLLASHAELLRRLDEMEEPLLDFIVIRVERGEATPTEIPPPLFATATAGAVDSCATQSRGSSWRRQGWPHRRSGRTRATVTSHIVPQC